MDFESSQFLLNRLESSIENAGNQLKVLCELEAMKIANVQRERIGQAPAFGEDEFRNLINKF